MQLDKQSRKLIRKLRAKVVDLGGQLELQWSHADSRELLNIFIHSRTPMTDATCVAAIDTLIDKRYGRPPFNVDVYNELLNPLDVDLKQAYQLQKLAMKYAHKFIQLELNN